MLQCPGSQICHPKTPRNQLHLADTTQEVHHGIEGFHIRQGKVIGDAHHHLSLCVARDVNSMERFPTNEHEIRFKKLGQPSTGYWRLTHGSSLLRPRQRVKKPWALPLTTMMNCPALLSNAWISPTNSQALKTFMGIILQCYANTWQVVQTCSKAVAVELLPPGH